jgi:type IX secretion system PorP/SprF family membrane protein
LKTRGYIAVLLLALLGLSVHAQDDPETYSVGSQYPLYSQYLLDGLVVNPAYAGTRNALSIALSGRKRMLGFDGENTLASFSVHTPLKKERVALGFSVNHMTYGVTKQTSFFGYYAFHINTDRGKWSLGLKAGMDMLTADYRGVVGMENNDPAFSGEVEKRNMYNVGTGLYYVSQNFFIGAAVPALISWEIDTSNYSIGPGFSMSNMDVLLTGGVLLSVSENVKLKPSFLMKYSLNGLLRLDANANIILYDFLWLGASWRIGEEALVALLELQVSQQLRLGYSYDYNMGAISSFIGGTHEVALRFDFGKRVSASNPRYF